MSDGRWQVQVRGSGWDAAAWARSELEDALESILLQAASGLFREAQARSVERSWWTELRA